MQRPTFFMVGAPKSGTTSMNEYFRQHPQLFIPRRQKDLAFFGEDLHRSREREPLEEYLNYYQAARADQRAGEVCVWYMYSERAPHEIAEFAPSAEIFMIVRNPVDLLYSQHSQLVYSKDEDIRDFAAALDAEPGRRRGQNIPAAAGNRVDEALYYRFLGEYTRHIARYFEVFGRERVHVIIYDDFRANTPEVVRQVFDLLAVDPDAPIDFRVFNANKVPRSDLAQRLLRSRYPRIESIYHSVTPSRYHGRLLPYLVRKNTRYTARAALEPDLALVLRNYFRPEVERLSELLDRDLTRWCADTPALVPTHRQEVSG